MRSTGNNHHSDKIYVQLTNTFKLILIPVTTNKKYVQRIWNKALHISIMLKTLPSIVIVYPHRRKKMGERDIVKKIVRFFLTQMSKIRV